MIDKFVHKYPWTFGLILYSLGLMLGGSVVYVYIQIILTLR